MTNPNTLMRAFLAVVLLLVLTASLALVETYREPSAAPSFHEGAPLPEYRQNQGALSWLRLGDRRNGE
jgi:hypothetical protein